MKRLLRWTLRALAAAPALVSAAPGAAVDTIFDWAERRYPELFAPGAVTQMVDHEYRRYAARHYTATGAHLGMVNGGMIYGLGPFTGGQLRELGSFETFLCQASPRECSPRPLQVLRVRIDAGSLQCEPGSGTSRLDMRRRLTDAGIAVAGSDCGFGHFGVPAACGGNDTRYWMFDIDASDAPRAAALGFLPTDAEFYPGRPDAVACSY